MPCTAVPYSLTSPRLWGIRMAQAWADTPAVMHPLLKFMAEMVYNKSQRVNFDNCSPNGILLFRETSRLLCAYGNQALASPPVRTPLISSLPEDTQQFW